jgi:serine/threonine protein kinase
MLQPGTALDNGTYRIESAIGRGGFGHVYRAHEELTGETVAIKELVLGLVTDPRMVQRFIQEARATLRLTHPHIARTHTIFRDGDTYYLSMEYLPGGSLVDRVRQAPLPVGASAWQTLASPTRLSR